jgi:hypothetical protein
MNLQRQRGLSLIWISVLFMLLGLVSMGFIHDTLRTFTDAGCLVEMGKVGERDR